MTKPKSDIVIVERGDEVFEIQEKLPLLPLRDVVIFPYMTTPLLVGRAQSVNAIERAVARDRILFCVAQRKPEVAEPGRDGLFKVGTIVRVLQLFRLPDGTMRVLVEGIARARVKKFVQADDYHLVQTEVLKEETPSNAESEALTRMVLSSFNDYVHLNRRIPDEVLLTANNIADPSCLAHTVASHLLINKVATKQEILEIEDTAGRLKLLSRILAQELEIVKLERKIEGQVRSQVHKNQKEFYLNEQLKAIRKELGYQGEFSGEVEELTRAVRKARLPEEVNDKALKELDRLSKMSFMSPEAAVVRSYLDCVVGLPWNKRTRDVMDVKAVQKQLDADHFGLKKVKDRIVEYISVLKLNKGQLKGPILCLVGPPGVGKTSLGKSIASALNRKFVRMSLGGVRDEAEIRGHRRTYIGSMPGRIIQGLRKAGTRNPLFLLDEIDKLGSDFRGDPAAALLEVLDPEQNHTFNDHYLEVDFDLSDVMFVTTANSLQSIPPALQDRMEIIRLPGYLETEKVQILKNFLLSKQLKANGLKDPDLKLNEPAMRQLINRYTRESGVRSLERELAGICRKVARLHAENPGAGPVSLSPKNLEKFAGPPRFTDSLIDHKNRVGLATGLAWTEVGGEVLTVEVTILPGRGELVLTGRLGEVMRESGQAAMSYARSRAQRFGLDKWFYKDMDVHVHMPEGAVGKDGPSAGITMATALISALTGIPTRSDVAMTGEITLRGTVLPIGGLAEKTVAARHAGVKTVLIPKANEKDIAELPEEVRRDLKLVPVETMDEVLEWALVPQPGHQAEKQEEPSPTYAH